VKKLLVLLSVLFLFAGIVSADIVPSAFSVSPTTVRPGVSGTLSFTITNTGTRPLTGVDLYPSGNKMQFFSNKIQVGSLGAGSSVPVTIPFRVDPGATAGIYNIEVSAYFIDVDTQGYKTFSYPVTVSSEATLRIDTVEFSEDKITAGDDFNMTINLYNTGGNAKDVRISTNSSYFSLQGVSQVIVGDLAKGEQTTLILPISTSVSTTTGLLSIPLTLTYEDQLGNTQTATVSAGPVNIYESLVLFSVEPYFPDKDYVGPGERITLKVPIKNVGNGVADSVRVKLSATDSSFVPVGSFEYYIESIGPGEEAEAEFLVGVSSTTLPGYYTMAVEIAYTDSRGQEQPTESHSTGVSVVGVSDMGVIVSPNPSPMTAGGKYSLSVQVSNIGTSEIKTLRINTDAPGFSFLVPKESYIGELALDDYSTVQYQVYADDSLEPGSYPVYVNMTFRDANNNERTVRKTAYVEIVNSGLANAGEATGGMTGLEMLLIAVLGIIVLYWVYGRFIRKKKKR